MRFNNTKDTIDGSDIGLKIGSEHFTICTEVFYIPIYTSQVNIQVL